MEISPLAGKPAPKNMLVDLARLEREYYERRPDIGDPDQLVSFGTSGHRGSSLRGTPNGWFAARPSGTENIYKIYAENFKDPAHLQTIVNEARTMVNNALKSNGPGPEPVKGQNG